MFGAPSVTTPLAALTTVFTPPAPCSASWLLTTSKPPSQLPSFPTTGPASCDPPSWTANLDGRGLSFYSPAICPSGFYVGPGCQVSQTRTAEGFPAVQPGETAAYCVPSGHTCTSDTTDFRGGVWGATSSGDDDDDYVTVGPALQIRFRPSDLSSLETHPLTPGRTLSSVASSSSSSTSTSTAAAAAAAGPGGTTGVAAPTSAAPTGPTAAAAATTPATGTTAPGPSQAPAGEGIDDGGGGAPDAGLVAVVVVSALTAGLAVCVLLLLLLRARGRRPCRLLPPWGAPEGLVPVGLGAWIGSRRDGGGGRRRRRQPPPPPSDATLPGQPRAPAAARTTDAELGLLPTVVVVAGEGEEGEEGGGGEKPALGSADNPAELEGADDEARRLSQRASWVSRLLSRVAARSSTVTRSSSQSRWTQRSLARSGGWEPFPFPFASPPPSSSSRRGEKGEGEGEGEDEGVDEGVGDLAVPPRLLARPPRPRTMSSSPPPGGQAPEGPRRQEAGRLSAPPAFPRFRSFDRLSDGTFGRIIVRGRSPGSARLSRRE